MMKTALAAFMACCALSAPGSAGEYSQYPGQTPGYPFQRSVLTRQFVVVPPYDQAFPVRVYTTPPMPPYYNVPPYAVISPY